MRAANSLMAFSAFDYEITANLDRDIDVLHLGTCMKMAMETAECPIDFDSLKVTLENKFGVKVVLGTHSY